MEFLSNSIYIRFNKKVLLKYGIDSKLSQILLTLKKYLKLYTLHVRNCFPESKTKERKVLT